MDCNKKLPIKLQKLKYCKDFKYFTKQLSQLYYRQV